MEVVNAPFTNSQVWSLNAYQDSYRAYRCPGNHVMIATCLGWYCPTCKHVSFTAFLGASNWDWKDMHNGVTSR